MCGGAIAVQSLLQLPQCVMLVLRFASHPVAGSPSQSAYPAWHVNWQLLSAQAAAVMFAGAVFSVQSNGAPQPPQLCRSALVSDSQPSLPAFCRSPLQSLQPTSHACPQALLLQAGLEWFGRSSQIVPQPPQLFGSVPVFTSQPLRLTFSLALQSENPLLHAGMLHTPPAQAAVPLAVPHG